MYIENIYVRTRQNEKLKTHISEINLTYKYWATTAQ